MYPRLALAAGLSAACLLCASAANADKKIIVLNDDGSKRVITRTQNDDGSTTIRRKFTDGNGHECRSITVRDGDGSSTKRRCNF